MLLRHKQEELITELDKLNSENRSENRVEGDV